MSAADGGPAPANVVGVARPRSSRCWVPTIPLVELSRHSRPDVDKKAGTASVQRGQTVGPALRRFLWRASGDLGDPSKTWQDQAVLSGSGYGGDSIEKRLQASATQGAHGTARFTDGPTPS